MIPQELEVKFLIQNLKPLQDKIIKYGGRLSTPRVKEINYRFDTPDLRLSLGGSALRLRMDSSAKFTYKGPSYNQDGVRVRTEIEFGVSDFDSAKMFLEALGYKILLIYEKYRSIYEIGQTHVMFDELPFGDFIEIEGPEPTSIKSIADLLGLKWEVRIPESYTVLFDQLKVTKNLGFRDLSFENFSTLKFTSEDLGVQIANV